MKKINLYYPDSNYFVDKLVNHISQLVKAELFILLSNEYNKLKFELTLEGKKIYINHKIKEVKENLDLNLFNNSLFKYQLKYNENLFFISRSSILGIIKVSSSQAKVVFMTSSELLQPMNYSLDEYNHIGIDDYHEYLSVFNKFNPLLLNQIINYIFFDTLINLENNLKSNSVLNTIEANISVDLNSSKGTEKIINDSTSTGISKEIQENKNIIDDEPTGSKSFELFDKVRNDDINDYDETLLLKEYSNNYELELLQSLAMDISLYLSIKTEEKQYEFTSDDIESAIKYLKENKRNIPYLKSNNPIEVIINRLEERKKNKSRDIQFRNLSIKEIDESIKKSIAFKKKMDIRESQNPTIDIEELLFPFEFYSIRKFEFKIQQKINASSQINNIYPVNWKGSPTELTALIKSLKESGKLDNSLSEREIAERFEKFFNFELKGYDQTKNKIRRRTIDYTPFIDKLKTNLEQWIKSKD